MDRNTNIASKKIGRLTIVLIAALGLVLAYFLLDVPAAKASEATLSSTKINVAVESTGYTSGTTASLDRSYYNSGDTAVVTWKGAKSGNNLIVPTSIKYGNKNIPISDLFDIDCMQSQNGEYKRRMNSSATMADFGTVAAYATKEHSVSLGKLTTDTTVSITWQKVVPVYRMYNMITSEHLFTTNKTEYDDYVTLGQYNRDFWIGEGIAWFSPESGSKTVHRLYNAGLGKIGSSSHYYTADASEIESLLDQGWVDDGSASQFQSGGEAAIYTCYNQALGSAHHYTASKEEWESLANHGWNLEKDKNSTTGVFSGILATSWSYTNNFYVVEHIINSTIVDTQYKSGRAGSTTNATAKQYPGYTAGTIAKATINSENSTVVQILYVAQTYKVNYDGLGKELNLEPKGFKYGEAITAPSSVNVVGYILEGWYLDSDCTQPFVFDTTLMPAGDITIYANWNDDMVDYKVYHRYQEIGGSYPTSEGESLVVEELRGRIGQQTQATLKNKSGFSADPVQQKVLSHEALDESGNDIHINYVRGSYDIHFNLNGGSYGGSIGNYGVTFIGNSTFTTQLKYGELIDFSHINKLMHHSSQYFAGWYTAQQYDAADSERWGYADLNDMTMPARQIHLYARWTDEQVWSVVYNTNGGTSVVDEEVTNGSIPTRPADNVTTRVGYTFEGWYSDPQSRNVFDFTQPMSGNVYLYAKWKGNSGIKYVVRHTMQNVDGTWENASYEDTEHTGTAGEIATFVPKQIEGFTVGTSPSVEIAGDGSTVVELKYSRKVHTVHFDMGGHGVQIEDQTVLYGARPKQPSATLSATGYNFEGWYKEATYENRYYWILNEMPDYDVTIYAKWTFIHTYWLGPASKITTGNLADTSNQPNPYYVNPESGYIKGESQIDADVEAMRSGNVMVMQEYRRYMLQDNYHLYVKWNGATDDAAGANSENGYVEFRIVNVGSHTEDGSVLTFQAIHVLPHAEQMNAARVNDTSWYESDLAKRLREGGDIYNSFEKKFLDKIYAVTKQTTAGGKSAEVLSTQEKLWIPSYTEITGEPQKYVSPQYDGWPGVSDDSEVYEGEQYYFFSQKYIDSERMNMSLVYRTRAGNAPKDLTNNYSFWWTRSPNVRFKNSFLGVYMGITASHGYADDREGVVLAFCF